MEGAPFIFPQTVCLGAERGFMLVKNGSRNMAEFFLAGQFDLRGSRAHRLYLALFVVWIEGMSDGEGDDDDATKVDQ